MWRRRHCQICGTVFTTLEGLDHSGSIAVRKPGALEPFSRDKLFISIYDSVKHRKTALGDATALTETILGQLYKHMQAATLESSLIVTVTVEILQRFDKVAAVHYQAYHPLVK